MIGTISMSSVENEAKSNLLIPYAIIESFQVSCVQYNVSIFIILAVVYFFQSIKKMKFIGNMIVIVLWIDKIYRFN